ncbi:MAG TPA: GntR family transcriptional regulator [Pirellulales bacterium]|nr:GntR family transcriptional regulator [Pirellulales bacterium]
MQFRIDPTSRSPIYRQLAEQIRAGVARGRLKPGEQLPSVRDLSRTLVVNPNTVARVYTELERDGVLHTRQGLGVFVAEPKAELTRRARKEKLAELLDRFLTEAVYLGFSADEVVATVSDRVGQFQWTGANT